MGESRSVMIVSNKCVSRSGNSERVESTGMRLIGDVEAYVVSSRWKRDSIEANDEAR